MSKEEIAISVQHVSKSFRLPHEKHNSIKSIFLKGFRRRKTFEKQEVLKDVSFEIKKGEFFGIVGRNGSGKSTLLKLISQIYTPDSGSIHVNGKLTPFIELGVGFNPELTGRENVFLNGALLGFSRSEIGAMYDEIVEFAELERFMDQKLKNYSSGMQVRLAFSIAIRAETDILVLDEVLAVGDEAFQRKCFSYFAELKNKQKTVILVTHSMESAQQFCTNALLLDDGVIVEKDSVVDVVKRYKELNSDNVQEDVEKEKTYANIELNAKYKNNKDTIHFEVGLNPKTDIDNAIVAFVVQRDTGEWVYRWVSNESKINGMQLKKDKSHKLSIEMQNIFPNGKFFVTVDVKKADRTKEYLSAAKIIEFEITAKDNNRYWKPVAKVDFS